MKEKISKTIIIIGAAIAPMILILMLFHIIFESYPAFSNIGIALMDFEKSWRPLSQNPSYNLAPMILATVYVAAIAVGIALVLGVLSSLYLCFFVNKKISAVVFLFVELLAGVPSVIFGFLGLVLLVKFFETALWLSSGECILSAAILLCVMLLPYVVSNSRESIEKAKLTCWPTAMSLGFSKEYAIRKVIFPHMKLSILTSAAIAFGRALGETMAVMMVIGNSPIWPKLFGRAQTIASLTALEIGSAEYGSLHLSAIYSANLILLILIALAFSAFGIFSKMKAAGEKL